MTSCVCVCGSACESPHSERTSISANADGPRDAASRKIDYIALPTEAVQLRPHSTTPTSTPTSSRGFSRGCWCRCREMRTLPGNERRSIANCYTQTEKCGLLAHISTIMLKLQLGRFFVDILYNQVCNRYSDKLNRWSLSFSV